MSPMGLFEEAWLLRALADLLVCKTNPWFESLMSPTGFEPATPGCLKPVSANMIFPTVTGFKRPVLYQIAQTPYIWEFSELQARASAGNFTGVNMRQIFHVHMKGDLIFSLLSDLNPGHKRDRLLHTKIRFSLYARPLHYRGILKPHRTFILQDDYDIDKHSFG